MSGAIPKRYTPKQVSMVHESCEPCENKNISISYKLKLKCLCQDCYFEVVNQIRYDKLKPLHHAKRCAKCKGMKVRQPYALICTLCALEKSKCVKCLFVTPWFVNDPMKIVMDTRMTAVLKRLGKSLRRQPLRVLFRLWKCYEKDQISLYQVRKEVLKEILHLYYITTGYKFAEYYLVILNNDMQGLH